MTHPAPGDARRDHASPTSESPREPNLKTPSLRERRGFETETFALVLSVNDLDRNRILRRRNSLRIVTIEDMRGNVRRGTGNLNSVVVTVPPKHEGRKAIKRICAPNPLDITDEKQLSQTCRSLPQPIIESIQSILETL